MFHRLQQLFWRLSWYVSHLTSKSLFKVGVINVTCTNGQAARNLSVSIPCLTCRTARIFTEFTRLGTYPNHKWDLGHIYKLISNLTKLLWPLQISMKLHMVPFVQDKEIVNKTAKRSRKFRS